MEFWLEETNKQSGELALLEDVIYSLSISKYVNLYQQD
jgi:hypothetical protein